MTSRGEFLGATVAAAAVPAVPPPNARAHASPYDFAAIETALARPARHRQVFATARIADGIVIGLVNHTLDAYEFAMAQGPRSLHPVIVLYGRAAILGLDDRAWKGYGLRVAAQRRGDDVLGSTAGDGVHPYGAAFRALVARGTTLFVCDRALEDWSRFLPSVMGADRSPDLIQADLRRDLLPGAILVPAGVAALNAAQEARFTYVQASL